MTDKEKQSASKDMVEDVAEAILSDDEFVRRLEKALNQRRECPAMPASPVIPEDPETLWPRYTWDAPKGLVFTSFPKRELE